MTTRARMTAAGLRKVFDRRVIFDGVSFALEGNGTLLITGRNGSGKSTLLKIIAGVLAPTAGTMRVEQEGAAGAFAQHELVGMVSPYLQMYEEFTAEENLRTASAIRGVTFDTPFAHALLRRVGLFARKDDPVRTFSSGMKQRVKYAFALLHRPPVLLLDEPMSNLDAEGIAIVRAVMEEHRTAGILVVATNDLTDCERPDISVELHGNH